VTTKKTVDQGAFKMTRKVAAERRARVVAIYETSVFCNTTFIRGWWRRGSGRKLQLRLVVPDFSYRLWRSWRTNRQVVFTGMPSRIWTSSSAWK
jgi:hypothetical protein